MAIEVKASRNIQSGDMKGLRDITGEGTWKSRILVCREPVPRFTDDGILILPVTEFFERLWAGSFA